MNNEEERNVALHEYLQTGYVYSVCSIDRNHFAASSAMGQVSIYYYQNPRVRVRTNDLKKSAITSIRSFRNSPRLLMGLGRPDCSLYCWNYSSDRMEHSYERLHNAAITKILILGSNDSIFATSSADGKLGLWDANIGKNISLQSIHHSPVYDIDKMNNHVVISCSNGITVGIWNVYNHECLHRIRPPHIQGLRGVSFRYPYLATASYDSTSLVYDIRKLNEHVLKLQHGDNAVYAIKMYESYSDGGYLTLFSGTSNGSIMMWNLETGECEDTLTGHNGWVRSLDLLQDGRVLISGAHDSKVISWDLQKVQIPGPSRDLVEDVGERKQKMISFHREVTKKKDFEDRLAWICDHLADIRLEMNDYHHLPCFRNLLIFTSIYPVQKWKNVNKISFRDMYLESEEPMTQHQFIQFFFLLNLHEMMNSQIQTKQIVHIYDIFYRIGRIDILRFLISYLEKNTFSIEIDLGLFNDFDLFLQRNKKQTKKLEEEEEDGEEEEVDDEVQNILLGENNRMFRILHSKIVERYHEFLKTDVSRDILKRLNFNPDAFNSTTKTEKEDKQIKKIEEEEEEEEEEKEEDNPKNEKKKKELESLSVDYFTKQTNNSPTMFDLSNKIFFKKNKNETESSNSNLILKTMDGTSFPVQKEILVLTSNFFFLLLKHQWKENSKDEFVMINRFDFAMDSVELTGLLEFLYTGNMNDEMSLNALFVLLNHSEMYFEYDLMEFLVRRILDQSTKVILDEKANFLEEFSAFGHFFEGNGKFKELFFEYWVSFKIDGLTMESLERAAKESRIHYTLEVQNRKIGELEGRVESQNSIIRDLRKEINELKKKNQE